MKHSIFRVATTSLAGIVVAGLALAGAVPASATPNQYAPSIGFATAAGSLTQSTGGAAFNTIGSVGCPAGTGLVNAYVDSATWTTANVGVLVIGANSTQVSSLTTTGITWDNSLANLASAAGKTIVDGAYTFSLVCQPDPFSSPTAQLDGSFTVTGTSIVWAALPSTAASSTTTLGVSAASIATTGSTTLTATVTSTATVAGTVQFKNGSANLGSPVTVAGGTAALTVTGAQLGVGTNSITAVFTPTDATVLSGSTSGAATVTVTGVAQATTTTLASSPAAPTTADVVTLTATLSPTSAVGSVTFTDTTTATPTTVGTAAVTGGAATVSLTGLAAGTHSYTAAFTPTNVANFLASTSAPASVTVSAYAGVSAAETLTTSIGTGTLTITASTTPVDLGPATLNSSNTLLTTVPKNINTVTVTDTRAGQLGYTVNGQATNFTSGANAINSENLGWVPSVLTGTAVAGPTVAAAAGVSATDPGTAGLKSARLLATGPVGNSIGTSTLTASLTLQAPTSSAAGTYNSTLTLTAI